MNSGEIKQKMLSEFGGDLCSIDADLLDQASADPWHTYAGNAAALIRPRNVEEVSAVVKWCHAHGVRIVPQGGNTGVAGGAIPDDSGLQVILNLSRMNRIREMDAEDYTAVVEAGCVLANVQEAAADVDRLFPLSFGAEGSCQIGGVLSTNAGGSNTLRYGNARDLVLGLEVVLADGSIWNGLRKLRKDNTGYDLRHLFMGAEGTLGIITAAVLKLYPRPRTTQTVLIALPDLRSSVQLLSMARDMVGDAISAFELMPNRFVEVVRNQIPGASMPPSPDSPWFALLEFDSSESVSLEQRLEEMLEKALEQNIVIDAALATSGEQRKKFWHLREVIAEAQIRNGAVIYSDVSVAISHVPDFIIDTTAKLRQIEPNVDVNAFGHVGDGNIHFNLLQPKGMDKDEFLNKKEELLSVIYESVKCFEGSISAEHGIGQAKLDALDAFKSSIEMDLMKKIRRVLAGDLLNPNKVVKV